MNVTAIRTEPGAAAKSFIVLAWVSGCVLVVHSRRPKGVPMRLRRVWTSFQLVWPSRLTKETSFFRFQRQADLPRFRPQLGSGPIVCLILVILLVEQTRRNPLSDPTDLVGVRRPFDDQDQLGVIVQGMLAAEFVLANVHRLHRPVVGQPRAHQTHHVLDRPR